MYVISGVAIWAPISVNGAYQCMVKGCGMDIVCLL